MEISRFVHLTHCVHYCLFSVVNQYYEAHILDEFVIRGNAVVLKCNIPSFVTDHVEVMEWIDSNGDRYLRDEDNSGRNYLFLFTTSYNSYGFPRVFSSSIVSSFHYLFRLQSHKIISRVHLYIK